MLKIFIPFPITPIINPPTMTPDIFPFPPKKLVPPIIVAAIAVDSKPTPVNGSAAPNHAVVNIPPNPEQNPDIINTIKVYKLTLIPEYHADVLLPPKA